MGNFRLFIEKNIMLVGAIIVLIGIILTASQVEVNSTQPSLANDRSDWFSKTYTPVSSLETPALLGNAIIWHPAGEDALVYERLDGESDPIRYEWVVGNPHDWQMIQASEGNDQHLIWLNTELQLWRSEINANGEQILAPILIDAFDVLDFGGVALSDGVSLIWWQALNGVKKSIYILVLDQWGRPLNEQTLLEDADQFALSVQVGQARIAWIDVSNVDDESILHYVERPIDTLFGVEDIQVEEGDFSIPMDDGEWIESLHLQANSEEISLIWGIMNIDSPDNTRFQGVTWESNNAPEATNIFEIQLNDGDTKLRWMGRVNSQQPAPDTLFAVNAYLDEKWQAILVDIGDKGVLSYEIIDGLPANASAPHIWIDENGSMTASWATIQHEKILQHVISNQPDLIAQQVSEASNNKEGFGETLLKLILRLPYGILWLILPIGMLMSFERNRLVVPSLQIVLILIVYWLGKALIHGDVLNSPPGFDYTDQDSVRVGVALGSSALVAGAIAQRIWNMEIDWQTVLMIFLIGDIAMTFLIFSTNLG